jgi:hypothetical protein
VSARLRKATNRDVLQWHRTLAARRRALGQSHRRSYSEGSDGRRQKSVLQGPEGQPCGIACLKVLLKRSLREIKLSGPTRTKATTANSVRRSIVGMMPYWDCVPTAIMKASMAKMIYIYTKGRLRQVFRWMGYERSTGPG